MCPSCNLTLPVLYPRCGCCTACLSAIPLSLQCVCAWCKPCVSVLTKSLQIQINISLVTGILSSFPAATLPLFNANQPQTCSSSDFFLLFSFVLLKHGVTASNIVPAWNSRNSLARWQLAHGMPSRFCACWSCLIQIHRWLSIK